MQQYLGDDKKRSLESAKSSGPLTFGDSRIVFQGKRPKLGPGGMGEGENPAVASPSGPHAALNGASSAPSTEFAGDDYVIRPEKWALMTRNQRKQWRKNHRSDSRMLPRTDVPHNTITMPTSELTTSELRELQEQRELKRRSEFERVLKIGLPSSVSPCYLCLVVFPKILEAVHVQGRRHRMLASSSDGVFKTTAAKVDKPEVSNKSQGVARKEFVAASHKLGPPSPEAVSSGSTPSAVGETPEIYSKKPIPLVAEATPPPHTVISFVVS